MYKFEIQWNTGDEYWDNFPDYDEFEGTIEGLNDYLNSQLSEEDPPACFDKEAWRALMDGKTVYDETGARYSVKLIDNVDESLENAKNLLKENGYILEDTDTLQDEIDDAYYNLMQAKKAHNGKVYKNAMDRYATACLKADKLSLSNKIEHAQDFNVDNRIENSSGFGTAIKNVYGKTILAQLKKKALKKGFDQDYIDSVEETMLHDDKIFDTATDFIEDVTDENYDLERLNVNQLLKKYGDKALKYVLKEIFNYYYEA